jgi:hypothetical protein
VIATVATEDLDGGVDRQSWQFAQLLHHRIAFFANAHGIWIRWIQRTVHVVRRHDHRPVLPIDDRQTAHAARSMHWSVSLAAALSKGRPAPLFFAGQPVAA